MVGGQLPPDSGQGAAQCPVHQQVPAALSSSAGRAGRTFQIAQTLPRSAWWKTCRWLCCRPIAGSSVGGRVPPATGGGRPGPAGTGGHGGSGRSPLQRSGLWRCMTSGAGHGAGPRSLLLLMDEPTAGNNPKRALLAPDAADAPAGAAAPHGRAVYRTQHGRGFRSRPTVRRAGARASCWPKVRPLSFATTHAYSRPTASVPASFLKNKVMNQM